MAKGEDRSEKSDLFLYILIILKEGMPHIIHVHKYIQFIMTNVYNLILEKMSFHYQALS